MRRTAIVLAAAALLLGACSGSQNRTFERYYDPAGQFSTYLPAGNQITVVPPQPSTTGPGLVSGVRSTPPQPSPSAAAGSSLLGQNALGQQAPSDQTIYQVFAVTTGMFSSPSDMALFFLTGDPQVDMKAEQNVSLGSLPARLVVADITPSSTSSGATVAAAFSLGERGRGYIVAAVFPQGTWDRERSDFFKVLKSFRTDVPPSFQTVPLSGGSA